MVNEILITKNNKINYYNKYWFSIIFYSNTINYTEKDTAKDTVKIGYFLFKILRIFSEFFNTVFSSHGNKNKKMQY